MAVTGTLDSISIIRLPLLDHDEVSQEREEVLVNSYRDFRLNALKKDPEVFASSFFEENNQPYAYWRGRLSNPSAVNLVAVSRNPGTTAWDPHEEWCGMIALIGPMVEQDQDIPANQSPWSKVPSVAFNQSTSQPDAGKSATSAQVLTYHISGAYTAAPYRRQGCGKMLLAASLDRARKDCLQRGGQTVTVGVHVDTFNDAAKLLYEKHSFVVVSEDTYPPRITEHGRGKERRAYLMQRTIRSA